MRNLYLIPLLTAFLCGFSARAEVQEFRIDQDRLWLKADREPLPRILEHFATVGITIQIDPEARNLVSGDWRNADAEDALDQILSPYDYLLDWRRDSSPLGDRITLTGIRVYRKGFAAEVQPLRIGRRIETTVDGKARFLAREILIGFGPGSSMDDLRNFLARTGGTVIEANTELGIYRILLPAGVNIPDLASQLVNDPAIALAEPNYVYDLPGLLPGGSSSGSGDTSQWMPPSDDSTLAVAVLDSGLVYNEGLSAAVLSAFDATNPNAPLTADAVGHGTLMAQLAAGLVDPYNTAVGEGVPVVAVKAFADDGSADAYTLMNAMTYAVAESSGPVSLSWGSETPSKMIENAINYAINHGSPVVAAVGNENTGRPMYPAAYPGVIGVAASNGGDYADYSNRGDFVDIVAPGSAGGSQGTSVATAYVAHILAKYQAHHTDSTTAQTIAALLTAAGDDKFLSEDEARHFLIK